MPRETEVPEDPEGTVGDPSSIEVLHEVSGRVSGHFKKDEGAEWWQSRPASCSAQMMDCLLSAISQQLRAALLRLAIALADTQTDLQPKLHRLNLFWMASLLLLTWHPSPALQQKVDESMNMESADEY